jgi:hypothetical protein
MGGMVTVVTDGKCQIFLGRDSAVGIATGYGLDGRGVGFESR